MSAAKKTTKKSAAKDAPRGANEHPISRGLGVDAEAIDQSAADREDTTEAAKKAVVKKATAKKATVKPSPAKKAVSKAAPPRAVTRIIARVDVRFGNVLTIRGEGGGLNWTTGQTMKNLSADEWMWETRDADSGIVFKFLVNDEIWAHGEDQTVAAGSTSISTPTFY